MPPLSTIDYLDDEGATHSMAELLGKVVVLDVCAASFDPCLLNANMVDNACQEVCGDDVVMISMLLDDGLMGPQAVHSYREVIGVHQRVVRPGPVTEQGRSALGQVAIPQLIIFDRDGAATEQLAGATVSAVGIVKRVKDLL